MNSAQAGRKRIAILGGGISSLTTAYGLTSQPGWQDRYDITVYQMGWRLGGKGASGRGPNGRIEEHGLHIWMGWYANAFKAIREIYQELGRPAGTPLDTWDHAFTQHSYICFGEQVKGEWKTWPMDFPASDETPGTGGEYPSVWAMVHEVLEGLYRLLAGDLITAPEKLPKKKGVERLLEDIAHGVERVFDIADESVEIVECEVLLREARDHAAKARESADQEAGERAQIVVQHMHSVRSRLLKHLERRIDTDDEARRLFYILDTGVSAVAAVLSEVPHMRAHALDALDQYDLRELLAKYGADPRTVQSALIRAFYDLLFAYRDGNPSDQKVAAGVSLRFIFHMSLGYKGAVFWKMQAGMGDTIFGPMYEVLKRRGVKFNFFHRVRTLELTPDKQSVARIHLGRQATVIEGEYHPLFDVKGLPCWPSHPLYDQLVEGEELKREKIDLESLWTPWKSRETPVTLEAGRDYDQIVFGISIASIPYVARELMEASPRWTAMVQNVETVRTQAVQLWLKPDLAGLGWPLQSAVTDAYPEPLDTWADMSHLLPRENWPAGYEPGNCTYFCAPMIGGIPPVSDQNAPAEALATVKSAAIKWLNTYASVMWPKAVDSNGFNWELLIDTGNATGVERFESQYSHANIDPSERYVLSVPKSTPFRLHASDQDFNNLFITGDWTYCGVNAGCVEGTVISGLLTSSAMCGYPAEQDIIGYNSP